VACLKRVRLGLRCDPPVDEIVVAQLRKEGLSIRIFYH
jgi:hypothetical protein